MASVETKRRAFRQLHTEPGLFVIPNPWDLGSARILEAEGFLALATTSAGMAFSMGQAEGSVSFDAALAHCRLLAEAVDIPVSADLEKGIGDSPADAGTSIRMAIEAALAGASLEDHTGDPKDPIYPFDHAVERIRAAAEVRDRSAPDFVLTARCENFLWGQVDLDEVIARLQAFEQAGADVLFAPGLKTLEQVQQVAKSLQRPINVIAGLSGSSFSLPDLAAAGVKRVSLGSSLARLAYGSLIEAAKEITGEGRFAFVDRAASFSEIEARMHRAL
ncbi:isocitrate lyase/PEP mutase family protein [Oryzibacter oryziterrae]|uniref:isocitrate lyase/PEP mutase family protein n=1 Tax=Oryzibacter oryziterrae TaxID=2766474 RepID=UPI001F270244|nr:isocitrate lyase/phosphoenolpyruvate mutase family protein [Oryzibacter oryziterrae]